MWPYIKVICNIWILQTFFFCLKNGITSVPWTETLPATIFVTSTKGPILGWEGKTPLCITLKNPEPTFCTSSAGRLMGLDDQKSVGKVEDVETEEEGRKNCCNIWILRFCAAWDARPSVREMIPRDVKGMEEKKFLSPCSIFHPGLPRLGTSYVSWRYLPQEERISSCAWEIYKESWPQDSFSPVPPSLCLVGFVLLSDDKHGFWDHQRSTQELSNLLEKQCLCPVCFRQTRERASWAPTLPLAQFDTSCHG